MIEKMFFLFFLASWARGAADSLPAPLTWEQCAAECQAHNPDLRQAEEALSQARYNHLSAFGQFLPKVSATASFGQSGTFESQPPDTWGKYGTGSGAYSASVNASETLFSGGSRLFSLDKSGAQVDLAEATLADSTSQAVFDLKTAFTQLQYSRSLIDLSDAIVSRRAENRDLVELRYDSGAENKGSFLQNKASWRLAVHQSQKARLDRQGFSSRLAKALGRKASEQPEIEGDLSPGSWSGQAPDFTSLALLTPACLEAKARMASAKASLKTALAAWSPTLQAVASVGRGTLAPEANWPPQNGTWSAGLNLSYELFNGGTDWWNVATSDSAVKAAEAAESSAEEAAFTSLRDAWNQAAEAYGYASVAADLEEAASMRAEIARAQYGNGLVSYVDWDTIENSLIDAQNQSLAAKRDAVLANAAWLHALGKGF